MQRRFWRGLRVLYSLLTDLGGLDLEGDHVLGGVHAAVGHSGGVGKSAGAQHQVDEPQHQACARGLVGMTRLGGD